MPQRQLWLACCCCCCWGGVSQHPGVLVHLASRHNLRSLVAVAPHAAVSGWVNGPLSRLSKQVSLCDVFTCEDCS